MVLEERKGDIVYPNLIEWWNDNSTEFPLHSVLVVRFLAIPATQAQSERTFSSTRWILTKARNRLDPDNLELVVSLVYSSGLIDEWRRSNAASVS